MPTPPYTWSVHFDFLKFDVSTACSFNVTLGLNNTNILTAACVWSGGRFSSHSCILSSKWADGPDCAAVLATFARMIVSGFQTPQRNGNYYVQKG